MSNILADTFKPQQNHFTMYHTLDNAELPSATYPKTCGNCGQAGHEVIRCWKSMQGYINGCACCNESSHATQECKDFPHDIEGQIDLLVTQRGGMPPLASPEWYPIMYEAIDNGYDLVEDWPLPWTAGYSITVEDNFNEHEYKDNACTGDYGERRVTDPSTFDWETAQEFYMGMPATLHAALAQEKEALKAQAPIVSNLRPSKISWAPISAEEKELVQQSRDLLSRATTLSMLWSSPIEGIDSEASD